MKKRGLNDIPRHLDRQSRVSSFLKPFAADAGGSDCRHSCMTPPYVSATSPSRRTCARKTGEKAENRRHRAAALHALPPVGAMSAVAGPPRPEGLGGAPLRWATPSSVVMAPVLTFVTALAGRALLSLLSASRRPDVPIAITPLCGT